MSHSMAPLYAVPVPDDLFDLVEAGAISVQAAFLYGVMLRYVNYEVQDASVSVCRRDLARRTGLSKTSTIDRYINELEAAGLISKLLQRVAANGGNAPNCYTLHRVVWDSVVLVSAPKPVEEPAQTHYAPRMSPTPKVTPEPEVPSGPTALYRWWDDAGILLYIGITGSLVGRQTSHAKRSSWGELASTSTVERFASRAEARDAEELAIRSEMPLFNHVHNDTPEARARLVEYLVRHNRLDLLAPNISRG